MSPPSQQIQARSLRPWDMGVFHLFGCWIYLVFDHLTRLRFTQFDQWYWAHHSAGDSN